MLSWSNLEPAHKYFNIKILCLFHFIFIDLAWLLLNKDLNVF